MCVLERFIPCKAVLKKKRALTSFENLSPYPKMEVKISRQSGGDIFISPLSLSVLLAFTERKDRFN
jgi:hypothetical protein